MWDDMKCSNCGDPAVVLLGGGWRDVEEVERAACERCRPVIFDEVMAATLRGLRG